MKTLCLYIFLLTFVAFKAQDKIYFTDGSVMSGKVLEIGTDRITLQTPDDKKEFDKEYVLMIHYNNGTIEKYTRPEKEVVYSEDDAELKKLKTKSDRTFERNHVSLNTLALINSDVSVFYERITANQKFGFGVMSALNFNPKISVMNTFVAPLYEASKKYDLGGFVNAYSGNIQNTAFHYGVLLKYMQFDFTALTYDTVNIGNSTYVVNTISKRTSGSQLSTIITFGTHTFLTRTFFIKTLFGVGGFNLRGDYKQQYNYWINNNVTPQNQYNRGFLLKLYFGINAGFSF